MKPLLPPGWPRPKGYSNGILAEGRMILTAGIVGWDENERFVADDLAGQFEQVLKNILAILHEGGAGPEHVARMTWYVTDRDDYVRSLPQIGRIYREHMGRNFPAMAVVEVSRLVEPQAKVEIETIAVIPAS
jgi:enamine deaminase RidA (YjgF/YER057c/UK114 family)